MLAHCKEVNMERADTIRVELELDCELLEALISCADRYPDRDFNVLVRALLIDEACRSRN